MKKWPWFLMSFLIVLIDQGTKYWAVLSLSAYHPKPVMPMLNFTLAYNPGAAFSFLSEAGGWQRWLLASVSVLMSLILTAWMYRTPAKERLQLAALSFLLGGAFGNLIDRVMLGYVVDFIDVYYKHYHWPIFNIADSAICLGAILLFIGVFQTGKKR